MPLCYLSFHQVCVTVIINENVTRTVCHFFFVHVFAVASYWHSWVNLALVSLAIKCVEKHTDEETQLRSMANYMHNIYTNLCAAYNTHCHLNLNNDMFAYQVKSCQCVCPIFHHHDRFIVLMMPRCRFCNHIITYGVCSSCIAVPTIIPVESNHIQMLTLERINMRWRRL